MYTKEEREGILWEFRRGGLSAPAACRSLHVDALRHGVPAHVEHSGDLGP